MIRTLAVLLAALFVGACCEAGDEPAAPYPEPDDTIRSSGSEGYATVTYVWFCRNEQFVSVTYVRNDECSDYEKEAEFTSEGQCTPAHPLRLALAGLSAAEQVRVLRAAGREIRFIEGRVEDNGLVKP